MIDIAVRDIKWFQLQVEMLSGFYLLLGGDSGLDGLGGPGVQLGSPDKKKRKTNTQVNWHFLW